MSLDFVYLIDSEVQSDFRLVSSNEKRRTFAKVSVRLRTEIVTSRTEIRTSREFDIRLQTMIRANQLI